MSVLRPEDVVDALVEALGHEPGAVDEGRVELARGLLELRLDEVGVGPRLLAVQDAGADCDRVEHQPRHVLAVLLALMRQAHRAGVVDDEAVDPQAPGVRADLGEGERGGSFHDRSPAR